MSSAHKLSTNGCCTKGAQSLGNCCCWLPPTLPLAALLRSCAAATVAAAAGSGPCSHVRSAGRQRSATHDMPVPDNHVGAGTVLGTCRSSSSSSSSSNIMCVFGGGGGGGKHGHTHSGNVLSMQHAFRK